MKLGEIRVIKGVAKQGKEHLCAAKKCGCEVLNSLFNAVPVQVLLELQQ